MTCGTEKGIILGLRSYWVILTRLADASKHGYAIMKDVDEVLKMPLARLRFYNSLLWAQRTVRRAGTGQRID